MNPELPAGLYARLVGAKFGKFNWFKGRVELVHDEVWPKQGHHHYGQHDHLVYPKPNNHPALSNATEGENRDQRDEKYYQAVPDAFDADQQQLGIEYKYHRQNSRTYFVKERLHASLEGIRPGNGGSSERGQAHRRGDVGH